MKREDREVFFNEYIAELKAAEAGAQLAAKAKLEEHVCILNFIFIFSLYYFVCINLEGRLYPIIHVISGQVEEKRGRNAEEEAERRAGDGGCKATGSKKRGRILLSGFAR